MLLAPLCIRKWGKKRVLLFVNGANVLCILAMGINMYNIWWLFICVYFNWLVGAFEQITTPAIQADIRDYQQYKSGERIDGMFAAVTTIGNVITLFTSGVLPAVQEMYGIKDGNSYESPYDILDVTTGEPGLLYKMMGVLIVMAAVGAFLNMVPYFFYDFSEKKQKSVVRVLQVRALFEDYGNNALDNHQIVEAIDMVEEARKMSETEYKPANKDMYRNIKDKSERKLAKKAYKEALAFNEEIDISKFVCEELDKFDSPLYKYQIDVYQDIFDDGLDAIVNSSFENLRKELEKAKSMPKSNEEEKEIRKFAVQLAKKKISARKSYDKYFGTVKAFVEPDMAKLTAILTRKTLLKKKYLSLLSKNLKLRKLRIKTNIKTFRIKSRALTLN